MHAEIVCIGTELLLGDVINSNAATMGRMLAEAGIACYRHSTVGDNEERIAAALEAALSASDAVIVSGGLGPTQDDVTREAVCMMTGQAMVRDERMAQAIRLRFKDLKRHMPEINLRQAERPQNATPIEPVLGTAPGLIVEHGDKTIYLVPGVPSEMEEMLERAVIPHLRERAGLPDAIKSRVIRVTGMAESAVAEAVAPLWDDLAGRAVTMAFLAGGGEVRIRLTARRANTGEAGVALADAERRVREALGNAVVGRDEQTLESVVLSLLDDRDWTLACAESLTGGLLGSRITDAPGASNRFRGSIVAYSSEAKASLLGIPAGILTEHGAVSAEVALAMARGARDRFGADVGVSTTGVAGPDTQEGIDVGTVFVAVSGPPGDTHREVHLPGNRETIRRMATAAALNLVRLYLMGELP